MLSRLKTKGLLGGQVALRWRKVRLVPALQHSVDRVQATTAALCGEGLQRSGWWFCLVHWRLGWQRVLQDVEEFSSSRSR